MSKPLHIEPDPEIKNIGFLPLPQSFMMRPVLRGVINYVDLKNGNIDLADLDLINRALDVNDENERRLVKARQAKNK